MIKVKFQKVRPHATPPQYQTEHAAGMDIRACFETEDLVMEIHPGCRALVPTGLKIALPPSLEAQVRPRSGLALKHGITVLNAPGTIDADYRGEVCVILINHGNARFVVLNGDKIAQLVIAPVLVASFVEGELDETARGSGGFGSTG